jgi:phosphatidylglycerophosphate synthase
VRLSAPELLIAFRAVCAPAIVVLACVNVPGAVLAAVLVAALFSDIFDGVIARRQGTATAGLRSADTIVDTVFYVSAAIALHVAVPGAFDRTWPLVVVLTIVHVSRNTFELTKYGRIASYHMWSSKLLGVLLAAAFMHAFLTARPGLLLGIALWVGVLNELEGFAASVILPSWRADVPSLIHAISWARREAPAEDRA